MSNDINKDNNNTEEKDNNTKENKDTTIKIDPDVVEVALEFAYREYMNEEDRKKNLETKTSYIIAIGAIIGTFMTTQNPVDILKLFNDGNKLVLVLLPLLAISYTLFAISMFIFATNLTSTKYLTLDSSALAKLALEEKYTKEMLREALLDNYTKFKDNNKEYNKRKNKRSDYGIYLLLLSALTYVVQVCIYILI